MSAVSQDAGSYLLRSEARMTRMMPKISRPSTIHVSSPLNTIGPAATIQEFGTRPILPPRQGIVIGVRIATLARRVAQAARDRVLLGPAGEVRVRGVPALTDAGHLQHDKDPVDGDRHN